MSQENEDPFLEKVRKMPLVADYKFRRFFSIGTEETIHVIEVLLKACIPGIIRVKSINCQKHVFDEEQEENVTDLEVAAEGREAIWIEMQRWNKNISDLSFLRWEKLRLTQIENHDDKRCFLVVLYDTQNAPDNLWQDFKDKEIVAYSMRSKEPLGELPPP